MMEIKQEIFNFWSIILQILTAGGLIYFAWRQTQINKRMQELSDYVALSIMPAVSGFSIEILNVGRANLYIHKWQIGSLSETYVKPLLLPTEAKSKISINYPPQQVGQHVAKLYLTDETDQKFISTGEVVVEPVAFQLPLSATQPQGISTDQNSTTPNTGNVLNVQLRMRAWSYKTEKENWNI